MISRLHDDIPSDDPPDDDDVLYVVAEGDPFHGLKLIGPFVGAHAALTWLRDADPFEQHSIVTMQLPQQKDNHD